MNSPPYLGTSAEGLVDVTTLVVLDVPVGDVDTVVVEEVPQDATARIRDSKMMQQLILIAFFKYTFLLIEVNHTCTYVLNPARKRALCSNHRQSPSENKIMN